MKSLRFGLVSTAALCVGCASAPSYVMPAPPNGAFDGTWEGFFTASTTDDKGGRITFPINLKLTIKGKDVHVFGRESNDRSWGELGVPDRFTFDMRGTTGVIYANRAGRIPTPEGSRWFETYLVAVAVKAPGQLLVHWMRMVTNVDTPVNDPEHVGVSAGDGVLEGVMSIS